MIMRYFIIITAVLFFQNSFNMALADDQSDIDEIRKKLYSLREKLDKARAEKKQYPKLLELKNEIHTLEQQLKTEAGYDLDKQQPQSTATTATQNTQPQEILSLQKELLDVAQVASINIASESVSEDSASESVSEDSASESVSEDSAFESVSEDSASESVSEELLDVAQVASINIASESVSEDLCNKQWPVLKAIMDFFSMDCSEISKIDLQSIQALDLQNAGMKRVSEYDFSDLPNLQELYLYGNKLKSVFPALNKVKNIKVLILGNNQIADEGVEGKWKVFKNLEKVVLNNNRLTKIPKDFQKLTQLKELNVSGNQIDSIPPELSKLKNLQKINLRGNKLKDVPKEWKALKNLQWIDLSENEITNIPKEWVKISTLKTVILSSDRVDVVTKKDLRNLFNNIIKFI